MELSGDPILLIRWKHCDSVARAFLKCFHKTRGIILLITECEDSAGLLAVAVSDANATQT
jgi:hypothetical protein